MKTAGMIIFIIAIALFLFDLLVLEPKRNGLAPFWMRKG